MAGPSGDPRAMQQGLTRLADLLLFSERFSEDPRAALDMYGLTEVPDEAVRVIADLSPEELRLFAQVQRRLGDVPMGDESCLLF